MTPHRPPLAARLALLLSCLAMGAVIGAGGWLLTGSGHWFLALPAVIAIGWLFVADPTRCEATGGRAGAPDRPDPRSRG